MTTVWQGDVSLLGLEDGINATCSFQLEDLRLQLPRTLSTCRDQQRENPSVGEDNVLPPDVQLRFAAYVETARMPLGLMRGPRLEACTLNSETEQRLWELLVESQLQVKTRQEESLTHDVHHTTLDAQDELEGTDYRHARIAFESHTGLLFHIDSPSPSFALSHILLYAASVPQHHCPATESGLATPPRSSSPPLTSSPNSREGTTASSQPAIHVYAQMLASPASLATQCPTPPESPHLEPNSCTFFPTPALHFSGDGLASTNRPRLDVFSAASHAHKRQQRRGGKGVAQLMAGSDGASDAPVSRLARAYTTGSFTAPLPPIDRSLAATRTAGSRPGSRHSSPRVSRPGSRMASRLGLVGDARPVSRNGLGDELASIDSTGRPVSQDQQQRRPSHSHSNSHTYNDTRHPSLQRVVSLDWSTNGLSRHSTPEAERELPLAPSKSASALSTTASTADIGSGGLVRTAVPAHAVQANSADGTGMLDAANKAALSRIVLAALRMWGHSASASSGNNNNVNTQANPNAAMAGGDVGRQHGADATAPAPAAGEDFKALYHAAYSAAKFALRHEPRCAPWEPERMRERVEQVLGVFLGG